MKNKKNEMIIIIAGVLVVIGIIIALVLNHGQIFKERSIRGVSFYEVQKKQSFENASYSYNTYLINSEREYKVFNEMYDNPLKEKVDFKKKVLFVQTHASNASGIKMKVKSVVSKDKKLVFNIDEDLQDITPTDKVMWYFVASIPKKSLNNMDLREWSKPSFVRDNN